MPYSVQLHDDKGARVARSKLIYDVYDLYFSFIIYITSQPFSPLFAGDCLMLFALQDRLSRNKFDVDYYVGEKEMTDKTKTLTSALLAVPAILALLLALFLCTRGGGWFSFIFSCPFWSAAILLLLAALRLYRVALFGFIGAITVGGIAFAAGFFGPIIFTPDANQGPLLGIFFTGPLGTIVGTVLGVLTAIIMKGIRQPKDGQVFSESAPGASSEKPSS